MRIRLTLGLDVQRHPAQQAQDVRQEPVRSPDVDTKGSFILDRAPQNDFDPDRRIGFLRNQEAS